MSYSRLSRRSFAVYSPARSICAAIAITLAALIGLASDEYKQKMSLASAGGVHATQGQASSAPERF